MKLLKFLLLSLSFLVFTPVLFAKRIHENFIYFPYREPDGINIRKNKTLTDPRFQGAQIVYTWRTLEIEKDKYDFSAIKEDLAYLNSINKKLWVQLQEKSFLPNIINIPDYMLNEPFYNGGVLKQSMLTAPERDPSKPVSEEEYGWSAKIWEKPVRDRYQKLIKALGKELDGKIEGINFSESSIEIGIEKTDGSTEFPSDFDPQVYVNAIISNMQVLRASFIKSTPMVYLNFLPGEWLPWQDKGYMRSLFNEAEKLNMGIGGPDLMPFRKSHMAQTYGFFKAYPNSLVKGMAVQDGNLRQLNPATGKKNKVEDIIRFSDEYLGLDYIFWVEEEPYFSREVLRDLPY